MAQSSVRITIKGRVQGVSFRSSLFEVAVENRVDGWVRNRSDGSVEALLQGEDEDVRKVIEWSKVGPPRAEVMSVTAEPAEPNPLRSGFRIVS